MVASSWLPDGARRTWSPGESGARRSGAARLMSRAWPVLPISSMNRAAGAFSVLPSPVQRSARIAGRNLADEDAQALDVAFGDAVRRVARERLFIRLERLGHDGRARRAPCRAGCRHRYRAPARGAPRFASTAASHSPCVAWPIAWSASWRRWRLTASISPMVITSAPVSGSLEYMRKPSAQVTPAKGALL